MKINLFGGFLFRKSVYIINIIIAMKETIMNEEERIEQLKLDIYNVSVKLTHYIETENWDRVHSCKAILEVLLSEMKED